MVRMNKNLHWVNLSFFGDVQPQFVLSDQDGVLVGQMSFQEKKIICSPVEWILFQEDCKWKGMHTVSQLVMTQWCK